LRGLYDIAYKRRFPKKKRRFKNEKKNASNPGRGSRLGKGRNLGPALIQRNEREMASTFG